jgi:hypothetical protein
MVFWLSTTGAPFLVVSFFFSFDIVVSHFVLLNIIKMQTTVPAAIGSTEKILKAVSSQLSA